MRESKTKAQQRASEMRHTKEWRKRADLPPVCPRDGWKDREKDQHTVDEGVKGSVRERVDVKGWFT